MNEQSEKKKPAKEAPYRPAYIRKATPRTREWAPLTPMAMLAGLVVWATPLLLPNAALTASVQTAPQRLNAWKPEGLTKLFWGWKSGHDGPL